MLENKLSADGEISRHPILAGPKEVGLLVVDMQEKFERAIPDFDKIVKNIVALVKSFQMFDLPIIVTEQYPEGLGKTVQEISDCFPVLEAVEKVTFSSLQTKEFASRLVSLKVKRLAVCGIEAHICVHQSVHDLLHNGYEVWVPQDATGSRDPRNRDLAVARMEKAGAIPTSTEMLLFEMAMQAGTESFKQIQKLIK